MSSLFGDDETSAWKGIVSWAEEQGFVAGLADPARSLFERLSHPGVLLFTESLRAARVESIGDFLSSPVAVSFVEERAHPRLRREIIKALRDYLSGRAPAEAAPAPGADLSKLAENEGLAAELDRAAWTDFQLPWQILDALRYSHPPLTPRLALQGRALEQRVGPRAARAVQEALGHWLRDRVQDLRSLAEEEAAESQSRDPALLPEALRGLVAALEEARAAAARNERPRRRELRRSPTVELQTTLEALRFRCSGVVDSERWRAAIAVGEAPDEVVVECEQCPEACVHCWYGADLLLEKLFDPTSEAQRATLVFLGLPRWKRFLARCEEEISPQVGEDDEAAQRISFRLYHSGGQLMLEAYRHRPTRGGKWSAGSRIPLHELQGGSFGKDEPELAPLAEVLHAHGGGFGLTPYLAHHALELLIGYPHVYLASDLLVPVRIRRAALRIDLEPDRKGGFQIQASLEGRTIDDWQRLTEGHLVVLEEPTHECLLVRVPASLQKLSRALGEGLPTFPPESAPELLDFFGRLGADVPITVPDGLEGERIPADVRLYLRLTPLETGELEAIFETCPLPEGRRFAPGTGAPRVLGRRGNTAVHAVRELEEETAAAEAVRQLLPLGPPAERQGWTFVLPAETALDLVAALPRLEGRGDVVVEWPKRRVRVVKRAPLDLLRVSIEDRHDWFGLAGGLSVDGEEVPLDAIFGAVREGRRYVSIGPDRWLDLSEELRARLTLAAEVTFEGRGGLEVGPAGIHALQDLLDESAEVRMCDRWARLTTRLRGTPPPLSLGEPLASVLRPYQREGVEWLARLSAWGLGACLADDMGLGKTLQTLAVLALRAERGPALVVAPTSVCANWLREAERFTPSLRVRSLREGNRSETLERLGPGDVLVASYGLVVRSAEALRERELATLVLDEAQAVKNASTARARAVRDLRAEWRLALTGTPLENHLGELWSLFRILCPGLLGSPEQFRARYAIPIERDRNGERLAALGRVVRPFVLRRTKAQVAPELPPRTEVRRLVSLSRAEHDLYEAVRTEAVKRLSGVLEKPADPQQARFAVLAALTRLRQLACHPKLIAPESRVGSSRLAELLELVREMREEGHRGLIFSQFVSLLSLLREALDRESIPYQYLDGATPEAKRVRVVDAFQGGEGDLFLISLKAGGTGLNLTAADYVVHLDPWWNPAVEDQASDRAHRIGQTRPVTVIRLVSKGTIEEAILSLHDEKRDLVAGLLDESGMAAKLSTAELLALIREGDTRSDPGDEEEEPEDLCVELRPESIEAQAEALLRKLGTHLGQGALRIYRRGVQRIVAFVKQQGFSGSVDELRERYLAALAAPESGAPASDRGVASSVLGHWERMLVDGGPVRAPPD